jgi:predicted NACHT family NTPase
VIITCHVAATDYSFTEFTYSEMADFSENQVELYVRKWFGKEYKKAEMFLTELRKPENRGLQDLGQSPLLLSMFCPAYNETLKIPKRRVELYEEALDALLKKWDASRNIQRDEIYKKLSLGFYAR